MIGIADILKSHSVVDARLAALESTSRSAKVRTYWSDMRMLNDHAYFMLVFGRFEQHVDDQCSRLIRSKRALSHWKDRRLWDATDPDRIDFMRRVGLLAERGNADFNRTRWIYKEIRCKIAHGDNAAVGAILLGTLAAELRGLSKRLRA